MPPPPLKEEVPAQQDMRVAGVGGFLPYKATAELIHATLIGWGAQLVDARGGGGRVHEKGAGAAGGG